MFAVKSFRIGVVSVWMSILSIMLTGSDSQVSSELQSAKSTVRLGGGRENADQKLQIHFELSRNKIILPVTVGDSKELRVILDTGMHFEGVLLYRRELEQAIDIKNPMEVRIGGAGGGDAPNAIMGDSMTFCAGNAAFSNQRIIILRDDRMKDFPSDGVTGYTLFGSYAVEIDYDGMLITLHDTSRVEVDSSWESVPLTFKSNMIPWLNVAVDVRGTGEVPLSVYVDLASSEAIELLVKEGARFDVPEGLEEYYLGRGLSGDIYGQKGKIASLRIGSFTLRNVTAAFAPAEIRSKQEGADGVVANNALRRFNLIFDYGGRRLYLKPNSHFNEPFE